MLTEWFHPISRLCLPLRWFYFQESSPREMAERGPGRAGLACSWFRNPGSHSGGSAGVSPIGPLSHPPTCKPVMEVGVGWSWRYEAVTGRARAGGLECAGNKWPGSRREHAPQRKVRFCYQKQGEWILNRKNNRCPFLQQNALVK